MKRATKTLIFLTVGTLCRAEEAAVTQPELTVSARPLLSASRVGEDASLALRLQHDPDVLVLAQGLPGGQSDLSVRGSGFSGVGLSLGGLSLNNPQTEHFNSELPLSGAFLSEPEILLGVEQAKATEGHLVGSVALKPLPVQDEVVLTAGGGEHGSAWGNVVGQGTVPTAGGTLGVGAFVGRHESDGVDLPQNDLEVERAGGRVQWMRDAWQVDFLGGHQRKDFGARGYYGVNPLFPATESTEDTLLYLGATRDDPATPLSISLLWRETQDDYRLQLPTGLFQNMHTSQVTAVQVSGALPFASGGRVHWRLAGDREEIRSSNLGRHERDRVAATLLPEWTQGAFRVTAGARFESLDSAREGDDDALLPQAKVEWALHDGLTLHLGYSESLRRPSFTELDYESPGSLGNSELRNQTQDTVEAGLRAALDERHALSAVLFERREEQAVDWIRADAAALRWTAVNLGDVTTRGADLRLSGTGQAVNWTLAYTYLDKDTDEAPYASRYFLDYARHFAQILLTWKVCTGLEIEAVQRFRLQVPNALREAGGDEQSLGALYVHYRPKGLENVQFSLMAENIWDDDYRIFPGQDTVSRSRYSASVSLRF